jgi:hypothetical protein
MITMSSDAMLLSLLPIAITKLRRIIGLALVALVLTGCGIVRLAYDQAPMLAYWWIDGYVDLNAEQTPMVRDALERWFAWHRRSQLPEYAAVLARAQRELAQPTTAAAMCALVNEAERRLDVAVDAAAPALAELVLSLTPEQLRHLERQATKKAAEVRADFAQPDPAERRERSFKRTLERYENFYGPLDAAQRERLAALLVASPFDADRWQAERSQRNREMVQTLTSTIAASRGIDRDVGLAQAQAAVRTIAERATRSPRPAYRAYQQRLLQDNCALVATMHNHMTPEQRQHVRSKLKGWEDDLRVLVRANGGSLEPMPRLLENPR